MEMSLWKALLCKISSFFGLSTSDNFSSEPVRKIYQNIKEILKLLKTIVDPIVHSNVASNDMLTQELEQLAWSIDECGHLLKNWHPLASRAYLVLQAEVLATGIQAHVLEIVRLLKDSCQYLPAELSSASLEMCIQKVNNIGCQSTSTIIVKAIQDQAVGLRPERWSEIAHCLGLRSNQDVLVENVALEKLMRAKQAENSIKVDYIEQLITMFIHMHNHLSMLKQSRSCVLIPDDFCCPLSLELMRDPVILASGQIYERASIKKWFDLGLTECPKTRQTLGHTNMIPNYTCRALIFNWCQEKDFKLPDIVKSMNEESPLFFRTDLSETGAEIQKLVEDLKSESIENLREITAQLLQFAEQNMDNRILIADSGGISLLVNLLHSVDPMIQENVVTSLLYMAINDDNKTAMTNAGAIGPLIHVLEIGTLDAQENAAATLFCLSMIKENKSRIGRLGAICPLVDLLRNGTPRGKNHAAIALFNLSIFYKNKGRIVQAGAVKHLVELMNPTTDMIDKAVAVLANLATIPEGRIAIGQAGGIPVLVEVVELGSARGKENAAAALLQLCTNSSRFCNMVFQEGAVPPLVALSHSGTPRAKEKAQALLGFFRNQRGANAGRANW